MMPDAREGCTGNDDDGDGDDDDERRGDSLPYIIISAVRFNRKPRCGELGGTRWPSRMGSCVLIRCNKKVYACII